MEGVEEGLRKREKDEESYKSTTDSCKSTTDSCKSAKSGRWYCEKKGCYCKGGKEVVSTTSENYDSDSDSVATHCADDYPKWHWGACSKTAEAGRENLAHFPYGDTPFFGATPRHVITITSSIL
jgi:hypothetical protein